MVRRYDRFNHPMRDKMLYLAATGSDIEARAGEHVGIMTSPNSGSRQSIELGRWWGSDCDVLAGGFDEDNYFNHIEKMMPCADKCLFCVIPDVPGHAEHTRILWEHSVRQYGELSLPLAYVMQDGSHLEDLPEEADVFFLGGTDEWRERYGAVMLERGAALGKRTHVGRVNSARRVKALAMLHCDSVDGTYLAFCGVDHGLKDVGGWMAQTQARLFHPDDIKASVLPAELTNAHRKEHVPAGRRKGRLDVGEMSGEASLFDVGQQVKVKASAPQPLFGGEGLQLLSGRPVTRRKRQRRAPAASQTLPRSVAL